MGHSKRQNEKFEMVAKGSWWFPLKYPLSTLGDSEELRKHVSEIKREGQGKIGLAACCVSSTDI